MIIKKDINLHMVKQMKLNLVIIIIKKKKKD